MHKIFRWAVLALAIIASPAFGQNVAVPYSYPSAGTPPTVPLQCDASYNNCLPVTSTNPMPVSVGSGASASQVQGNVASASADSGNPVKVGGKYNSTLPTFTDGQRGDLQIDAKGRALASVVVGATASDSISNAGIGNLAIAGLSGGTPAPVLTGGYVFNGTTWDRLRGDVNGLWVGGNVASGVADAGNPVKIGGVYNSSMPNLSNGQRGNLQLDANGNLSALAKFSSTTAADAISNSNLLSGVCTSCANGSGSSNPITFAPYLFNGTSWDRARGDTSGAYEVIIPSASSSSGTAINASSVASSSLVGKGSAGTLFGYNVTTGASAGYVMIFNATSAPADGAVTPARCIPIAANTGIEVNLRGQPSYFSTGITAVFSTTGCFTKTASATAFIALDVK